MTEAKVKLTGEELRFISSGWFLGCRVSRSMHLLPLSPPEKHMPCRFLTPWTQCREMFDLGDTCHTPCLTLAHLDTLAHTATAHEHMY